MQMLLAAKPDITEVNGGLHIATDKGLEFSLPLIAENLNLFQLSRPLSMVVAIAASLWALKWYGLTYDMLERKSIDDSAAQYVKQELTFDELPGDEAYTGTLASSVFIATLLALSEGIYDDEFNEIVMAPQTPSD